MYTIKKLTPEIQSALNKALVTSINAYSMKYEKRNKNTTATDIALVIDRDGLVVFLTKIKYLAYHIDSNELQSLCNLVVLYSTAYDLMFKVQNFLEI